MTRDPVVPLGILIVDDSKADSDLAQRALRKLEVAGPITWLEDGVRALDYLFRRGEFASLTAPLPALVLLDVKMPRVDGLEVLEQLKANEATRGIPVVVWTSSREESDVRKAYALGTNSFVTKPVDYTQFSTVLSEVGHYWLRLNRVPS